MTLVWTGFIALLVLKLIRRHGWEYVPVLLIVAGIATDRSLFAQETHAEQIYQRAVVAADHPLAVRKDRNGPGLLPPAKRRDRLIR